MVRNDYFGVSMKLLKVLSIRTYLLRSIVKLIFLISLISTTGTSKAANSESLIGCHQTETISQGKRISWLPNNFSEPSNHSERRYRYVINAVTISPGGRDPESMRSWIESGSPKGQHYIISGSVVGSGFKAMAASEMGFILKVPPENILAAAARDIWTVNSWMANQIQIIGDPDRPCGKLGFEKYKSWLGRNAGLYTPEEILKSPIGTGRSEDYRLYNEVAILNDSSLKYHPIVTGFFFSARSLPRGRSTNQAYVNKQFELARSVAEKLNVPFVQIP